MVRLTVNDVLRECEGTLYIGNENLELIRFSKDTRTLQPGDVYFGIHGENFDGNSFYLDALDKGASCCILDSFDASSFQEKYQDRTIILVSDTVLALQKLAAYKRSIVDIPVVAVTGSAGKTSTKDMIASVLSQKYKVLKTPGNLNNQIGLPFNILSLQDEEVMVLEMGMNGFGQIELLTNIAKPTIGVITNIGTAHIGILGSRENILKAKLEILKGMDAGSSLVINRDNDLLSSLKLENYKIHGCGFCENAEYRATDIKMQDQNTRFHVSYHDLEFLASIPVMGHVFVENSLLAIAVGDLLGLNQGEIQAGLSNFELSSNRMQFLTLNGLTVINDTYNSNYEAVESALEILKKTSGTRKIAVLGDVLEMDAYAREMHEKIGMIPSLKEIDALFLNGHDAKYIMEGALKQGMDSNHIFYYENKTDLINALLSYLRVGDIVLVKASNGMKFGEIVTKLKESYLL